MVKCPWLQLIEVIVRDKSLGPAKVTLPNATQMQEGSSSPEARTTLAQCHLQFSTASCSLILKTNK